MKEIQLCKQGNKNKGKFVALVDDEDFEYLNQWKWCIYKNKNTYYATRRGIIGNIIMHRFIMKTPEGMYVDHIDHDGLNNQKSNLRNCTGSQNMQNRLSTGKSKYMGVGYAKKQIQAHITIDGVNVYIGSFKTEVEAAIAYDETAKLFDLEFANLNFK